MSDCSQKDEIRVIHLSSAVEWRGGEQQMLYLYKGLDQEELLQWIWLPRGQVAKRLADEDVNTQKLFFRQAWFMIDAFRLLSFCKKNKINLIHAHDSKAHSLAYLITDLLGLNCAVIVHRRVDNPIKSSFFTKKKYLSRKLEKIICVSSKIKNVLDTYLPQISEKSLVIYSGTSLQVPDLEKEESLRKKLFLKKDELLVGNISALDDHKDPNTFLKVAIKMIKAGFKAKFVWIGGGESWRQTLLSKVKREGMEEMIFFPGYIENARKHLRELDLFLFTSSSEGLGTTVIDAMMMKVPVVATAAGGVPELISDKETGILVSVADAGALAEGINWLCQNPSEKEKLLQAAFHKVNTFFSIEKMVKNTLILYGETIKLMKS